MNYLRNKRKTWRDYAALAKHYKAIGQTDIYLSNDEQLPWHLAESVESGATHRLAIPVSARFAGRDPQSGLVFSWTFDIEKRGADGRTTYQFDVPAMREVMRTIPRKAAAQFATFLSQAIVAATKQADEYHNTAMKLYGEVAELRTLRAEKSEEKAP